MNRPAGFFLRSLVVFGSFCVLAAHAASAADGYPSKPIRFIDPFAPAGMPAKIVGRLNAEIDKTPKPPDVVERLARIGVEPTGGTPQRFSAFIKAEIQKWSRVIKDSGIRVD